MIERLKDPSLRDRLKHDIRSGLPGWYNHYTAVGGDWSRMLVSARLSPANKAFEGQTMDRIIAAKTKGRDPAPDPLDVLFEFLIEENGSIGTIYAHHTESDMNLALVAALVLDRLRRLRAGDRRAAATRPPASQELRHVSARPGRICPQPKAALRSKRPSAR